MRRSTRVASIVLIAVAATACSKATPVTEVALLDGASRTLTVSVNTCNANPRAAVVEGEQQITITVEADRQPLGLDDCADSIAIELEEPLGDRRVIDGTSGQELPVTGRP